MVEGADGPHADGVDLGMLRIYTSDRDGFLRACILFEFGVFRPVSLPSTEDARLWSDDHDESRKSLVPRDDVALDDPFHPSIDASLWPRLFDSVTREGCVIGSGDVPRDDNGEGVAPRERAPPVSVDRVVDRPEVNSCPSLYA